MAKSKTRNFDPTKLKPFKSKDPDVTYAVIETPMGSRNKFKFDEKIGTYTLAGVLPQGMMFPHAFGFVPGTRAADGDPEDILVVMDLPVFTGCVVPTRLLGVIEAEQTEDKKTVRNDRLIGVAENSRDYTDVNSLKDLNDNMLDEIEKFFVNYNEEKGKKFKVLGRKGPQQALKLLKKSIK
ncbi:MAG: inorganic pyrophosphatase [Acidobacteriaceae bacterium]|jgi:inorganic pyrophosphatase